MATQFNFIFKIGEVSQTDNGWAATAEIKKAPSLDKLGAVHTIQFELGDESLPAPTSKFVEVNLDDHLIGINGTTLHVSEWRDA